MYLWLGSPQDFHPGNWQNGVTVRGIEKGAHGKCANQDIIFDMFACCIYFMGAMSRRSELE